MIVVIVIIVVVELLLIGTVFVLLRRTKKKNKISFQGSMDLIDLPIVTLYNGSRKLNFLLDSGANASSINEEDLATCLYKLSDKKTSVMGIEGDKKNIDNTVIIELTRKGTKFSEIFQVSDLSRIFKAMREYRGIEVNGILGTTFFSKYGYVLDFDDMVAYTK